MYSSQGIINYPTLLHLVGHFRILCHDVRKHEYQVLVHSCCVPEKKFSHGLRNDVTIIKANMSFDTTSVTDRYELYSP